MSHETIEYVMCVKMNMATECFNFATSDTILRSAKAGVMYNEKVSMSSKM